MRHITSLHYYFSHYVFKSPVSIAPTAHLNLGQAHFKCPVVTTWQVAVILVQILDPPLVTAPGFSPAKVTHSSQKK